TITGTSTTVLVTQSASSAKALTVAGATAGSLGSLQILSAEQLNVTGSITVNSGTVTLSQTTGTKAGINVTGSIDVGGLNGGSISLANAGTGTITGKSTLTADSITFTSSGDGTVGKLGAGFPTDCNSLTVNGSTGSSTFIKDTNPSFLNITG